MPKGEGIYPAPTHKRIEDLDRRISSIQKSTRATIPMIIPLHDVLRQKFRWYYRAHLNPVMSKFYGVIFILYIFAMVGLGANLMFGGKPTRVLAVTTACTWNNGGGTNIWNSAANWSCGNVPDNTNDVIFNGATSTANITIDAVANVGSFTAYGTEGGHTAYTGTITANQNLTTDTANGGTGDYFLGSGTYTANATTLTIVGNFTVTAGTFTAGTSLVKLMGASKNLAANGSTFNNLELAGSGGGSTDTGWIPAGMGADDASVGAVSWTTPTNIYIDDANYATNAQWPPLDFPVVDSSIKLVIGGSITGSNKSAGATWSDTEAYVGFGGAADKWGTTPTAAQVKDTTNFGVVIAADVPPKNTSHYLKATNFDFSAIPDGATIDGVQAQFKRKHVVNSTAYVNIIQMKVTYTSGVPATYTATDDFTVAGTLTTGATESLTINTAKTGTMNAGSTVTNNGTITGAGTLDLKDTAGANLSTGGTLSSLVRFNTATASVSIPARTYGSNVEIYNNTGTGYNATYLAGTHTYSGNLITNTASTGTITMKADTYNPTINIAGDMTLADDTPYTKGSGTTTFNGTAAKTLTDNNSTKQDIGIVAITKTDGTPANNKITLGSPVKVGTMTVSASNTLDLANSGYTLDLANAGATATVLTVSGTLTVNANSIVKYSATNSGGNVTVASAGYNHLQVSGAETYVLAASTTLTGNMTIDTAATFSTTASNYNLTCVDLNVNGSGSFTMNASTITTTGNVTVNSSSTITAGTSTLQLTGASKTFAGGGKNFNNVSLGSTASGDTGWVPAGAGADNAGMGTYAWSTPGNITADDTNYATAAMFRGISDHTVKLIVGGAVVGNNKSTSTALPATEATIDYGGAADVWGATLNETNVEASDFGLAYAAQDIPPVPPVETHYLFATTFGLTIPAGATIDGVEARIKRKAVATSNAYVNTVWLKVTYTGTGSNASYTATDSATIGGTLTTLSGSSLAIDTAKTVTVSNGATVTNGGTISGAGTLELIDTAGATATGGTLSSQVKFNTATAGLTVPARTYGSNVEVYNNTASNFVATPATGTLTIAGNFTITKAAAGTITVNADTNDPTINIGGSFANTGMFTAGASTVVLNTATTATVSGSTTFNNLTLDGTAVGAKQINFTAGTTQTINGTFTLTGGVGEVLTLRSTTPTSAWYFVLSGDITSGTYIDVQDSQNITNAFRITPGANVTDSGRNTPGWSFAVSPPTAPTIGTPTAQSATTIRWTFTDNASDETGFKVYATGTPDVLVADCPGVNFTYCDETGLLVNTQYSGRYVVAYNDGGNSAHSGTAAAIYTLANTPLAPNVNQIYGQPTQLKAIVNVNSNPAATQFAIQETQQSEPDKYVQADGSLNTAAVWQTYAQWGSGTGTTIIGLTAGTQYTFQVKARNGDTTETAFGPTAQQTTVGSGNTVSGSIYSDLGVTKITDAPRTINASINGLAAATAESAAGDFTITANEPIDANDVIVVYISGETEKGSVVTKVSAGGNLIGINIYQSYTILRHEGAIASMTNAILAVGDGLYGTDTDILFSVTGSDATFDQGLYIFGSKTYAPGGNVTVAGNWNSAATSAVFTYGTSTVNFTATSTGKTITAGGQAFYNLNFNGSGGDWTLSGDMTVNRTFTMTLGTFNAGSGTLTFNFDFTKNGGTYNADTSTAVFSGNSATINANTQIFNNLTVSKTAGQTLSITTATSITVNGLLSLTTGRVNTASFGTGSINAKGNVTVASGYVGYLGLGWDTALFYFNGTGAQTITLNGGSLPAVTFNNSNLNVTPSANTTFFRITMTSGVYNSSSYTTTIVYDLTVTTGTFNADSGTVTFDPNQNDTTTINANGQIFNNLTVNKYNGKGLTITTGTSITVNGTLTLTDGTIETGTINAKGTVILDTTFDEYVSAPGTLNLNGAGAQTFTINGGKAPKVIFSNSNLNVTPLANVRFYSLTLTAGTYNGGSLTTTFTFGFTVNGGTFNADTGTVDFTNPYAYYTTITANGVEFNNVIVNKQTSYYVTVTTGTSITINGTLTLTNGQLKTGTVNVKGNISQASTWDGGDAIYNIAGTGTQTLSGTGTATSFTTGQVTINNNATLQPSAATTVTTFTIASGGTLDVAGNVFTSTTFVNNGTLKLTGDAAVTTPTHGNGSTVEYTATSGTRNIQSWSYKILKINGTGGTFTLPADITAGENLIVSAGTLGNNAHDLTIGGNVDLTGGSFTQGTGRINLNGSTAQSFTAGGTGAGHTPYNITQTNASAAGVTFADSLTLAAGGTLTNTTAGSKMKFTDGATYTFPLISIAGASLNNIIITTTGGAATNWVVAGTPSVSYVTVDHNDASGGSEISATGSTDGNNNTNWNFGAVVPNAPTIGAPTAQSSTSIRWNFTDNASNETGFKVYDAGDVLKATCATPNLTYCDETGLDVNTQYTGRYVVAYNGSGNSAHSATAASIYTLANTPTAPTVTQIYGGPDRLNVIINVNSNPAPTEFAIYNSTLAQYVQADGTNGASAVWQNYAIWGGAVGIDNTGLNAGTSYTYMVKARNGDNTETAMGPGASATTAGTGNTVAGSLYNGIGGAKITDVKSIRVSINGLATASANTASGDFTVTAAETIDANDIVTVFVSGDTVKASAVTKVSAGGALSGINLYQNYTTLRHEGTITAMTNAILDVADGLANTDKLFTTDVSSNATFTQGVYILAGKTYAPGANVDVAGSWVVGAGSVFTNTSSTVTFTGNAVYNETVTSNGQAFNNVTVNNDEGTFNKVTPIDTFTATGTFDIEAGEFDADDKTINIGTFDAQGTGTKSVLFGAGNTWTVTGNWNSTGANLTVNPETSIVDFTGTGSIYAAFNGASPYDFYNLQLAHATKTITMFTSATVANTATVYKDGTLARDGGTPVETGLSLRKSDGNPLLESGAGADPVISASIIYQPTASIAVAGHTFAGLVYYRPDAALDITFTLTSNITGSGAIIVYNKTATNNSTLDVGANNLTVGSINIGSSVYPTAYGLVNLGSGTHTIAGNLGRTTDNTAVTNGLNLNTSVTSVGGNINFTGVDVTEGTTTLTMNATTTGKTITTDGETLYNLTFNGVGGGWTLSDNTTISGSYTVTNGTVNSGSTTTTFIATGTGKTITSGGQSFNNLIFNGTGGGWTAQDDLTATGNFTITNGTVVSGSTTVTIGGNYSNSSTFTSTGSTVIFNKSSSTQTLNAGGTGAGQAFNIFTHSGAGILQLTTNDLMVNGNFTNSAGTFDTNARDITVKGNIDLTTGSFTQGTGRISMTGTGAQSFTAGATTAGHTPYNLTLANTSGNTLGVTFTDSLTLATGGTFTNTTPDSKMTFADDATYTFPAISITGTPGPNIVITKGAGAHGHAHWNVAGTPSVAYVSVDHNDASGGSEIDATSNSTDNNDNTNWNFGTPNAPTGVTLTGPTASQLTANWTDNSSGETGFKVYVSTVPNADCSLATYPGSPDYTTAANAVTQNLIGLSPNTEYCVKVGAYNATGESSATGGPEWTLANTPLAPSVSTIMEADRLKIVINANSNPAGTQFAIQETEATEPDQYLQADGTLGASAVWQTYAQWGGASGVVNTGLTPSTSYTYQVKARNGDTPQVETAFGPSDTEVTPAPGDIVSGTLFDGIGGAPVAGSKTIKTSVNGGAATSGTATDGVFTIMTNGVIGADSIISVFVDGDAVQGSTVWKVSTPGDQTGINIYQGYSTLQNEGTVTQITNTDLATVDNVADTDVLISADGSNNVTFTKNLYIPSSKTYTPGANIATTDGALRLAGTLNAGTFTHTIHGDIDMTSGTLVAGTSTFIMNKTANLNATGNTFNNLQISAGTDGGTCDGTSCAVSGAGDNAFNGTYTNAGTFNSHTYYTYNNAGTLYAIWAGHTMSGDPTDYVWRLSLDSAKVTGNSPPINFPYISDTGNITDDPLPDSPWGVGTGGTAPAPTLGGAGSDSTVTTTENANVSGTLTVDASQTLSIDTTKLVYMNAGSTTTLNGTISGAGTLELRDTAGAQLSTGGTLSSLVRFNTVAVSVSMPARTYGGNVEIYNNTGSNYNATYLGGAHTYSGNFSSNTASTGTLTIKADTNDPTINIAGDFSLADDTTYQKGTGTTTFNGTIAKTYTDSNAVTQNIGVTALTKTNGTPANNKITLATSMKVDTMTVSASNTLDLASSGFTLDIANVGATGTVLTATGTLTTNTNSVVKFSATNSGGNVTIPALSYKNLITAGTETYDLGGHLTSGNAITGYLTIDPGSTLSTTASNYDIEIAGNWDNNGTFTANAGTVTFISTDAGKIISSNGSPFNNLTFNGAGGAWTMQDDTSISGNYTVTNGTVSHGSTTTTFTATAIGKTITSNSQAFNNLTFNGAGGGWTAQDDLTATGTFTLTKGTFNANSKNVSILNFIGTGSAIRALTTGAGTWTITRDDAGSAWDSSGSGMTFTLTNSTIDFTGSSTVTTVATQNFHNLKVAHNGKISTLTSLISVNNILYSYVGGTFDGNQTVYLYKSDGDPFIEDANPGATHGNKINYMSTSNMSVSGHAFDIVNYRGKTNDVSFTLADDITATDVYIYSSTPNKKATLLTNTHTITAGSLLMGDTVIGGGTDLEGAGIDFSTGTHTFSTYIKRTTSQTSTNNTIDFGSSNTSVGGSIDFTGIAVTSGTGTINMTKATGTQTFTSSGQEINNLTHSGAGTLQLADDMKLNGNFLNNTGKPFDANGKTVTLDGTATQTLTAGGATLYNLTITNPSSSSIIFADGLTLGAKLTNNTAGSKMIFLSGATYTLPSIDIDGASGNNIVITASGAAAAKWNVAGASPIVSYVTVNKNDASGGSAINATNNCTDGGDTTNWNFNVAVPPPTAPSNIRLTANSTTQMTWAWNDNSNNETGFAAAIAQTADCATGDYSTTVNLMTNVTFNQFSGLTPDTNYCVKVIAKGADDNSDAAYGGPEKTDSEDPGITNPTNVVGTAGDRTTNITWNNPVNSVKTEIYRSIAEGVTGDLVETIEGGTSHSESGLINGTTYHYTLKAVNSFNTKSAGVTVSLTPRAPDACVGAPTEPSNLRATRITNSEIDLAWDAPTTSTEITGYLIFNANTGLQVQTSSTTAVTLTGLSPETTYVLYVRSYNSCNNEVQMSPESNRATIITLKGSNITDPVICRNGGGQVAFLVIGNAPSEVVAGSAFANDLEVKVLAADGGGEICTEYENNVYFASTDPRASLAYTESKPYFFSKSDAGIHEFPGRDFTLNTAGEQILIVTDDTVSGRTTVMVLGSNQVFQKAGETLTDFFDKNASKVNTAVVTAATALLLTPAVINAAVGLGNLIPQLLTWFNQLLLLFGVRKRRKPWGVVFNSQTGQPIVLATVKIYDKEYNRLLETAITDRDGRFGFLIKPGSFYLVIQKSGFVFPSQFKVSGFYDNIYAGGPLEVTKEQEKVVNFNIPIDPEAKLTTAFTLLANLIKFNRFLQKIRIPLLVIGVVFAVIMIATQYNIVYLLSLGLYTFIGVLEFYRTKKARPYGLVSDIFEHPLDMSIVRIYNKKTNRLIETDVSDAEGRFQFLVDPGIYYMTAMKPGYLDFKSHIMYLEKEKTMVSSNIKLKKMESDTPAKK